jgi:hypothetical protein
VPLVSKPISFACRAERLAWAGSGPDRAVVGPAGGAKSPRPSSDAGEEVSLSVPCEVARRDINDGPIVDVTVRNKSG